MYEHMRDDEIRAALKTKHGVLKKTHQVHYTGCPYISICIIPKILYLRYFHKTTKDIVVYLVFPGLRS